MAMERRENCIKPRVGDADLWIKIWEELHRLAARDIVVGVEHVKAHRTKKDKKEMSQIEKFVTEGNEKAKLAKAGTNVGRRIKGGSKSKDSPAWSEKRCFCSMQPAFTVW